MPSGPLRHFVHVCVGATHAEMAAIDAMDEKDLLAGLGDEELAELEAELAELGE